MQLVFYGFKIYQNILGKMLLIIKFIVYVEMEIYKREFLMKLLQQLGHLKLDNLVIIYDSNNITIEGEATIAWSENVKKIPSY